MHEQAVGGEVREDIYYDPYDPVLQRDPYPTFRRMREEAPLYYNPEHDFYAVSRFEDVEGVLKNHRTYSSAKGGILELIKMDMDLPSGVFIFEDPPQHTAHRGLLSRVFTPRKMNALEPRIRAMCQDTLDELAGSDRLDFVADLGARLPMAVIGMLLGIPVQDQEDLRVHKDEGIRREEGKPGEFTEDQFADATFFEDYINWRREHPEQRRALVEDRSLIPNAVEELLRYEPPALQTCRYVTEDVEVHGRTVSAGSVMMAILASGNRDHRAFPPDGDTFDVRRQINHHLTFGHGIHFCLGAALARLEARVAMDEILNRWQDWEVVWEDAVMDTSQVRGWASMPVRLAV